VKIATLALAVALACTPAIGLAQDRPATREQAMADIAKPDVDARRQAAIRLGEIGTMADAPALLKALRDGDEGVRLLAERAVWQVWSRSGDTAIDQLFATGVEQMRQRQLDNAVASFSQVIQRKPDFAEGWNKRATLYFFMGELDKSLADCAEVVKRNPQHFGVLSGYGQIYLQKEQPERALEYFQRALAVNPNLHQVESAVEQLKRLIVEQRKGTI
jgi:tetratricopeptide (TPR) repeat protein